MQKKIEKNKRTLTPQEFKYIHVSTVNKHMLMQSAKSWFKYFSSGVFIGEKAPGSSSSRLLLQWLSLCQFLWGKAEFPSSYLFKFANGNTMLP